MLIKNEFRDYYDSYAKENKYVYITSRNDNRNRKIYKKILEKIGGSKKLLIKIYDDKAHHNAFELAPYISRRQISKLAGKGPFSNKYQISVNSSIILKCFLEMIKEFECKQRIVINGKEQAYRFCNDIDTIISKNGIMDNIVPGIIEKVEGVTITHSTLRERIDVLIKELELLKKERFEDEEQQL